MSLIAKQNTSNIEPIAEGVYTAVCYSVIDIGTQYCEAFDSSAAKVILSWEIPQLRIDLEREGQKVSLPRAISRRYTNSLGEMAILRQDLNAWRGRAFTAEELGGFDLKNVLGKACQLQVIHNKTKDRIWANVGGLMALPKGVASPKPENDLLSFSLDDVDKGSPTIPPSIPKWIASLIRQSREWEKLTAPATDPEKSTAAEPAAESDDVPF